jgi:hypothetical protein
MGALPHATSPFGAQHAPIVLQHTHKLVGHLEGFRIFCYKNSNMVQNSNRLWQVTHALPTLVKSKNMRTKHPSKDKTMNQLMITSA